MPSGGSLSVDTTGIPMITVTVPTPVVTQSPPSSTPATTTTPSSAISTGPSQTPPTTTTTFTSTTPSQTPTAEAHVTSVAVAGRTATVSLSCSGTKGGSCTVDAQLTIKETVRHKLRTVIVGTPKTKINVGARGKLRITLNNAAQQLLASRSLTAELIITESSRKIETKRLHF
jgi:hypothetical protein